VHGTARSDHQDAERLDEFLFGAQRISLDRVRGPLADSQARTCFYCAGRMTGRLDVDHFLPWSRHPDNTLDNLVAAHGTRRLSSWPLGGSSFR
jgi:hypothetical protein